MRGSNPSPPSGALEVSVVVPTYNEASNINELLACLQAALTGISHEIIIVDDDSPDRTWEFVLHRSEIDPSVRLLRRTTERGLSSAVLAGFQIARGTMLAVLDGDLSHDEKILPLLVHKLREGADLAVGSRRIAGGGATEWPFYRRWLSNGATALTRWIVGVPLSDPMSGYFVIRRTVYEASRGRLHPEGYKILLEIAANANIRSIEEVPFVFRNRRQGHSKLSLTVMWQFVRMIVRLKTTEVRRKHNER